MKRIFIIASLAIMAVGCQKTEIQNEVRTPIGFSTETGKQTRAIADSEYLTSQPFGVFSYGYDYNPTLQTPAHVVNDTPVMNNVEINEQDGANSTKVWKATNNITYYWPNDPDNYLNFYAYSPIVSDKTLLIGEKALANHQKLTGTLDHDESTGLSITGFDHKNMYVDFMVATPVVEATYANTTGGVVPVNFHHELTQVVFNVKANAAYSGVTFTIQKITLNDVVNKADYVNRSIVKTNQVAYTAGAWSTPTSGSYTIFPATTEGDNACPETINDRLINATGAEGEDNLEDYVTVTDQTSLTTKAVTMIPQTLVENTQSFTIEYKIQGTGVATEVVEETKYFETVTPTWTANKKITYNVILGLHEITFSPDVVDWGGNTGTDDDDESGTYYNPETIAPATGS